MKVFTSLTLFMFLFLLCCLGPAGAEEQVAAEQAPSPISLVSLFPGVKVYDSEWRTLPRVLSSGGYATKLNNRIIQVQTQPLETGNPYFDSLTQLSFDNLDLDQKTLFALQGRIRVVSAPTGANVSLGIWGAGENPVSPDRFSQLQSLTLKTGESKVFQVSLRDWTVKEKFSLVLHVSAKGSGSPVVVQLEDTVLAPLGVIPQMGVQRANLPWYLMQSAAQPDYPPLNVFEVRHKQKIDAIAASGARVIRFGIRGLPTLWRSVQYLKRAKLRELEILLTVTPDPNDYPNFTAGVDTVYFLGNQSLLLRRVNADLFKYRLEEHLKAFKNEGISISMIELGNELDGLFAGDRILEGQGNIPNPRMYPRDDARYVGPMIAKYAELLRVTHELRNKYYPQAKISYQGTGNFKEHAFWFGPAQLEYINGIPYPKGTTSPKVLLDGLRNFGGVNYIDNYTDCIGEHYYPRNGEKEVIRQMIRGSLVDQGIEPGTSICITEFGFKIAGELGGNSPFAPVNRYLAFRNFMDVLLDLSTEYRFPVAIAHQFDTDGASGTLFQPGNPSAVHDGFGIWDSERGNWLPGAEIFRQFSPRPR